jgi:hypothetical protein
MHLNEAHAYHGSNAPHAEQNALSFMKISAVILSTVSQYRATVIPPRSLFIPSTNKVYLISEMLICLRYPGVKYRHKALRLQQPNG